MHVTESTEQISRANLSYPDYLDWKRANTVFTALEVYNGRAYLLSTPAGVQIAPGARVSDGFFRVLGVSPILGRDFEPGEDLPSAARTVILSHAAWQTRFGGKENAIGQTLTLSGIPHTIIGVLPRDFQFAPRGNPDLWTTLHALGIVRSAAKLPCPRGNRALERRRLDPDREVRDGGHRASIGKTVSRLQSRTGREC